MEKIDDFCYPSSYTMHNGSCVKNVKVCTATEFRKIKIQKNTNVRLKVKMRLYDVIILSNLLYSAQIWLITVTAMTRWQKSILGAFPRKMLK